MRMQGLVAVVTGAGSGLGRAIAEAYAREGATLVVSDIRGETARETAKALPGDGHAAVEGDVADEASVQGLFAEADRLHGRVDVVVNNAGVDRWPGDGFEQLMKTGRQLVHMEAEAFARVMAINVNGVFLCSREAARLMEREKTRGSIINMSSIAGLSNQGGPHYAASKSAVLGLTRACARELGPQGIRVNAICPGAIDTPMTQGLSEGIRKGLAQATPLQRLGEPEDVAATAVFLGCEESSFITGQWISPNGGLVMC